MKLSEEEIVEYLERYSELMAEYKGYIEIHGLLFQKIEKISKEIDHIEKAFSENGIKTKEIKDAGK